jgi:hypothetical protein
VRAEDPLHWLRGRGEGLRTSRAALKSERRAGPFEAVGSDPGGLTRRLARGQGPGMGEGGGSAISALGRGAFDEPGATERWLNACTALLIEGLLLWAVGWLLDRFFGFGAALMGGGSLLCAVALVGYLLTPLVWAADLALQGVRAGRAGGDHAP